MIPWLAWPLIVFYGTCLAFGDLHKPPAHPACDPTEHHCS